MAHNRELSIPAHPDRTADRYTKAANGKWERWALGVLNMYETAAAEDRQSILKAFYQLPNSESYLPKNLFMVEALFDFGKNSPFSAHAMEIFKAVMEYHEQQLTPDRFNQLVTKIQGSSSFPDEARNMFGQARVTPSIELQRRRLEITIDETVESDLLHRRKLPTDPDKMLYILKKIKKGEIGQPSWPTFLTEVAAAFNTTDHQDDWDEIKEAIRKLKKKQPRWFESQNFTETR